MGRSRGPLASAAGDEEGGWYGGQRSKRRRGAENLDVPTTAGTDTKRGLYHCNYCNKDVSGTIRIKCAKCVDFDLCLECFSVGVEVTTHKSNHPYRVIENLSFPLIYPDWNADEEILLLDGVEMYGLGNWAEVAEHVGTKNKAQCFEHYNTAYMNSPCSPLPDMSHVLGKSRAELMALGKQYAESKNASSSRIKQEASVSPAMIKIEDTFAEGRSPTILPAGYKAGKIEVEDIEGRSSDTHPNACKKAAVPVKVKEPEPITTVPEDGNQSNRSLGGKKPKPLLDEAKHGPSITDCFNPKRQEFDPEYDNDAELPLADMEFKDNDNETDRELKLQMLHIYLARLDERKRRKEFILQRDLLNIKRQQMQDRKRSKEEREMTNRFRVFLRYHSNEEHDVLLAGFSAENKLRQRIAELQEYRSAGCHTLAEGEAYILEKKQRLTEANLVRKGRDATALGNKPSNRYNRSRGDGEPSSSGNGPLPRGRPPNTNLTITPRTPSVGMKTTTPPPPPPPPATTTTRKSLGALDLAGLPGSELLSPVEHELCTQLRLSPGHYFKMKEVLMLENAKKGLLRREEACLMFKIDPTKVEHVFEFLSKMGWIQSSSDMLVAH